MSNATNIICLSGSREKLQMAAMVASVSVACGDQVTVFFSMNALEYFVKGRGLAAQPKSLGSRAWVRDVRRG